MVLHPAPVKVFIADDSPLIRTRVASMLASHAMTVVGQAETPQGAIDSILATQPDVVVLDIHLKGGSGLQVLQSLRTAVPRTAFVVFSNNATPAYRKRYLAEGAIDFLDKNAGLDQLALAVTNAKPHPAP